MPEEQPKQMTSDEAWTIVSNACEIAGEAPADELSLLEKVKIAQARELVRAFFVAGQHAVNERVAKQAGPKDANGPARRSPKGEARDESLPGETPAQTIERRAREVAAQSPGGNAGESPKATAES